MNDPAEEANQALTAIVSAVAIAGFILGVVVTGCFT